MASRMGYVVVAAVLLLSARGILAAEGHAAHAHDMSHGQAAPSQSAGDPYILPTDPVTGEKLGPDAVLVNHHGRELRFASKQTAERFQANPQAYLKRIDQQMIDQQKPLYPLTTCPVSGEKLEGMGGGVDVVYNNRLVRFCCPDCQKQLQKDPAKYLRKVDEAVIKAQKPNYPAKECPVSGQALGSMGEGVDYVAGNRLIRFCCGGCINKFKQNPAAYLEKMATASPAPAQGNAPQAGHDHH